MISNLQAPTIREIGRACGYFSKCGVDRALLKLERAELITRSKRLHRGIQVVGLVPDPNVEIVHCPKCASDLPFIEFGIALHRPSGRNLYCKNCNRKKAAESRPVKSQAQKRKPTVRQFNPILSPADRVREAMRKGARTQKEIADETGLYEDEIGDVLVELLLWKKEIITFGDSDNRIYLLVRRERVAA